jgi:hypothetical protein
VASTDSRIRVYEQISGCKKVCFGIEKEEIGEISTPRLLFEKPRVGVLARSES